MTFLAVAILPNHGIMGKTLDGKNSIYVDMRGEYKLLPPVMLDSAMAKHYYLPLKLTRIVTPEQAVEILKKESDEYAKLYE